MAAIHIAIENTLRARIGTIPKGMLGGDASGERRQSILLDDLKDGW